MSLASGRDIAEESPMNRPTFRWTRWLLVATFVPAIALAAPPSPERRAIAKSYDSARQTNLQAQARAAQLKQQMGQLRSDKAGRAALRQELNGAQAQARTAKAAMLMAHAEGLLSKAAALEKSDPGRANAMLDKAIRLEAQAKALGAVRTPKQTTKQAPTAAAAPQAEPVAEPIPAMQAQDGEGAPGVDGPAKAQLRGLASRQGKQTAKLQLQSGNLNGALGTLERMEAQANRRGVMGLVDRYRKWSTKNEIYKQSYKMGKTAARAGDVQLASDAVNALDRLGKDRWGNKGKIAKIATQAIKGARSFSKQHRPEETRALLDLAASIQRFQGREKPTLRYRFVRWSAKRRLTSDIELRAKQGNMEAFRSAMRLASAYAKEDGRELKPGELAKIKKLYITALKNSVVRSLDDANALLSGKMGYVNPEEAASRYLYAMETHDKLAQRGIKVSTGLFSKSVKSKFAAVRAGLIKAQESGMHEVKRPGFVKRVLQKLFVAEHKRQQPGIAPVDGKWMARQQRAQQMEMERMAAAQQGGAELMME
jgi:hypothetical protein